MKASLIFLFTWLGLACSAQKTPANLQAQLDSVNKEWLLKKEAELKLAREAFYQNLATLNPDSVTKISMRNLKADSMPDLRKFKQLTTLDLSGNKFTSLPKKLLPDAPLVFLKLSDNPWKKLKWKKYPALKTLTINNTGLRKMPRAIRKLKNLETLNFNNNDLEHLPGFIKNIDSLVEITLNFNKLNLTESDIKKMRNQKRIQLIGNNLTVLPDNIGDLQKVERLNLAQNRLHSLPASFAALRSLKGIVFYKNSFTAIPAVVFNLTQLTELDFYYNNLTVIPDSIDRLKHLQLLFLAYNKIETLPESLRTLTGLQKLFVHHNNILAIEQWLPLMPNLQVLDLGYNRLAALPDFSRATQLEEVDIQENNLSDIPWALLQLPHLKTLYIRGNPFAIEEREAIKLKAMIEKRMAEGVTVVF